MSIYQKYWIFTSLLILAVVYALYAGIIGWTMEKFPDIQGQLIAIGILTLFLYVYGIQGHRVVKLLSQNIRTIEEAEACHCLAEVVDIRSRVGEVNLGFLYDYSLGQFSRMLFARIRPIRDTFLFFFLLGVAVALLGIVQGYGYLLPPTSPEEAKLYSSTILKALGMAYLPALVGASSALILYPLLTTLESQTEALIGRFDKVLFETIFLTNTKGV